MSILCSCVILNYNDVDTTLQLIDRIRNFTLWQHIIVVDNCSTDDSYLKLKALEDNVIDVIQNTQNGGYGAGNNLGINYAKNRYHSKYIVIANPDVFFSEDTVSNMLRIIRSNSSIGVVAPIQLDINRNEILDKCWKLQNRKSFILSGERLYERKCQDLHYSDNYFRNKDMVIVDCVPGAFLMVDADKFIEVGGYDDRIFLYGEEIILAMKMKRRGYVTVLDCQNNYIHEHSVSINKTIKDSNKIKKILLQSRLMIVELYYGINFIEKFLITIFYGYCLLEYRFLSCRQKNQK